MEIWVIEERTKGGEWRPMQGLSYPWPQPAEAERLKHVKPNDIWFDYRVAKYTREEEN